MEYVYTMKLATVSLGNTALLDDGHELLSFAGLKIRQYIIVHIYVCVILNMIY